MEEEEEGGEEEEEEEVGEEEGGFCLPEAQGMPPGSNWDAFVPSRGF